MDIHMHIGNLDACQVVCGMLFSEQAMTLQIIEDRLQSMGQSTESRYYYIPLRLPSDGPVIF